MTLVNHLESLFDVLMLVGWVVHVYAFAYEVIDKVLDGL